MKKKKSGKRIFAIVLLVVIGIGGFYFGYDIGRMDHDEERIRAELKKTTADSEVSTRPVAKGGTGKTEIEILTECLEDVKAEDEMHVYQFSYDEIKKKCRSFLEAAEGEAEAKKALKFEDFEIQEKDSAGYVSKFRIGNTVCSGDEFRDALSLASSAFSIQEESGGLKITTMGKGHGLGMSQWTANELAKNGQNYKEILEFFFEGTTITNSEEILEKPE